MGIKNFMVCPWPVSYTHLDVYKRQYVHRKVNNYGLFGKILGTLCFGSLFVCVKVWYPMKERIGSEFMMANKKYFRIYDTFNMFNAPS